MISTRYHLSMQFASLGALSMMLVLCLACQKTGERTKAPQWNSPAEEAYEATLSPPTDQEWEALSGHLLRHESKLGAYDTVGVDRIVSLDFWRTFGKRFAAVFSARSDSVLVYSLVVGRYFASGNELEYYYAGQNALFVLSGQAQGTYLELDRSGELWKLFDAGRFWEDESKWAELYNSTGLMIDDGDTYRSICWTSADDVLPYRARGKKTVPTERNAWLLQIGFLAAQEGVVIQDTVSEKVYPTSGADFLVFYDNWFGAIVSRRNDSSAVYRAIVGQHMADSILYRYLDDSARMLSGIEMKGYKRLAEHDSLWSLEGPYEDWKDRAGLERLWTQAGQRRLPDSSGVATRVLRFGHPPN